MSENKLDTNIYFSNGNIEIDTDFNSDTKLNLNNLNGQMQIIHRDNCIEFLVEAKVLFRWPSNNSSKLDEILEHLKIIEDRLCHNTKMINAL